MRLKYLASFIVLVLIVFLIYKFLIIGWHPEPNDISPMPAKLTHKPSLQAKEKQSQEYVNPPWSDFVYPAQVNIRDPFQLNEPQIEPEIREKKTASFLMLTGVVYNEQNPIAIFTIDRGGNSYLVKENDAILDFTVKKILKRSVILRRADTDIEFKVFDEVNLLKSQTARAPSQEMTNASNNSGIRRDNETVTGKRNEMSLGMKNEVDTEAEDKIKIIGNSFNNKHKTIIPALKQRAKVLLNQKR
jgi:hypothetical protein